MVYLTPASEGVTSSPPRPGHRRWHEALEKPFVILGGSRDLIVWQHPAALPKLPTPALGATAHGSL